MMYLIYCISTFILATFLMLSSYMYFFSESTINGLKDLGFPNFFRIQLGVLKIFAVITFLIPKTPNIIKEWTYAGIAFFLITALVAHIAHKDSIVSTFAVLVLFFILGISHYSMF
ncbi:DoxX family protein [Tenacibaculum sp. M341]|uniref:DoxX family protein n=1 Tax=Tenacibaculum sp. M341 TaxID=2530339 RepID=UPI001FB2911E|nr:DoxX family protein [Tenacibaculum sp. M341]